MIKYRYSLLSFLILSPLTMAEIYNSRNAGMGGAGVASSQFDTAAHSNPALLASPNLDKGVAIIFPAVGAEASDKDEVIDTIDDLEDKFDEFEIVTEAATFDAVRATALQAEIIADLNSIDEKLLTAQASAILSVAVPHERFSWALDHRARGEFSAQLDFDPTDEDVLNTAIAMQDAGELDNINSSANITAAIISETVFSLATQFTLGGQPFSVGLSPKFTRVETYFYSQNANDVDSDDFDSDQYVDSETGVNADLGFAYYPTDSITVGLMFRDLVSNEYDTVTANAQSDTYEVGLSSTAGIAYQKSFFSIALDADLTARKGFKSMPESKFVRAGIELDALGWVQLRAGTRIDTNDAREDVASAGVNLALFKTVNLGVSGWAGGNDTAGAAVDLKIVF